MIRILGPLEAGRDCESRSLGGPRQRLVLAILLTKPNRLVTADELIDGLWGDHPPAAPRASLHSYISNLRRILGHDRIERAPGGYVIHLQPEDLDALAFEHLLAEAIDTVALDPSVAVGLLDEALSLWSGPAFGDLRYSEPLRAECVRLEELRLEAEEERFDALLALGTHRQALVELQASVARYPLRERFRGQLMLGLYRAGRQAEALETFREYRLALDEELGLKAGEDLWVLEERILQHDPGLLSQQTAVATVMIPVASEPSLHDSPEPKWWPGSWRFASFAVGALLLSGSLGEGCEPIPPTATHWWSADRTAVDTLGGAAALLIDDASYGPGLQGDAFLLDGEGDFVDTGVVDLGFGTDDFSVALWVNFASTEGEQVLVEKWIQRFDEHSSGWTFTKLEDNSIGFFTETPTDPPQGVASAPLELLTDRWIHLAARRLGDRLEILVDGALVAYHPHVSVPDLTTPVSVKLGHRGGIGDTSGSDDDRGMYLRGALDEVLIAAGHALTQEEVRQLVASGAGGGLCPPSL